MKVRKAEIKDVPRICEICTVSQYDTYAGIHSKIYLDKVVNEFYNKDRVLHEVENADAFGTWYVCEDPENAGVVATLYGGKRED